MATTQELETQEQQLQNQLLQLQNDKIEAQNKERFEKEGLITCYENEAVGYRNQAEKATTDDEKKKLYMFADDAEKLANELRLELGLVIPDQSEQESLTNEKNKTERKVNGLLIKALLSLVAYFIADFSSARIDAGFFSFVLKSLAQIAYPLSAVFGGCWIACTMLLGFVQYYGYNDLKHDFKDSSPSVRLAVLAFLLASVLYFFANAFPDAN